MKKLLLLVGIAVLSLPVFAQSNDDEEWVLPNRGKAQEQFLAGVEKLETKELLALSTARDAVEDGIDQAKEWWFWNDEEERVNPEVLEQILGLLDDFADRYNAMAESYPRARVLFGAGLILHYIFSTADTEFGIMYDALQYAAEQTTDKKQAEKFKKFAESIRQDFLTLSQK